MRLTGLVKGKRGRDASLDFQLQTDIPPYFRIDGPEASAFYPDGDQVSPDDVCPVQAIPKTIALHQISSADKQNR